MPWKYPIGKTCVGNAAVFWDVEDCPIPRRVFPESICQIIKSPLEKKRTRGIMSIRAFAMMDNDTIDEAGDPLCYAGIRLVHEDSGSIVDQMQKEILIWALEHRPKLGAQNRERPNLVVIAKNVKTESDFGRMLFYLNLRNYNVIAVVPNEVACPYANSVLLWTSFFD
ncbi:unnamed protein product [Arabis nemorensis]|uniref:NYN domain-containing protein n=1 Tax=Arabis nemorensis TaxID=586526 RepID=A0A565BQ60_9BRAS|nr:unnamed protein product [Arabis nemorensis]